MCILEHQISLRDTGEAGGEGGCISLCVAAVTQQWEVTDWWNNEQRRGG